MARIKKRLEGNGTQDYGVLGKVSNGIRHPQRNYPMALDYFRFKPYQLKGNHSFVKMAEQAFPHTKEKPRNKLLITFSSDSDDNFYNAYHLRDNSGKLYAITDGHSFIELSRPERGRNGQISWSRIPALKKFEHYCYSNLAKIKTKQHNQAWLRLEKEDFGPNNETPSELGFYTLDWLKNKIEKSVANGNEKIKWFELLRMRFVLCNFRAMGRWEYTTKGELSTIPQIIQAYDAVKKQRGTVVGTQFTFFVQMVESGRSGVGRKYPVASMAPVETLENYEKGNLLLKGAFNFDNQKTQIAPPPKEANPEIKIVTDNIEAEDTTYTE